MYILFSLILLLSNSSMFGMYKPFVRFHKTQETLAQITHIISKKRKGAYLRFGDGDLNLALRLADLKQSPNQALAREMQEAFAIDAPTVLKALPLHCREFGTLEDGMFPGKHEMSSNGSERILKQVKPFWGNIEHVYSAVALHFCATNHTADAVRFLKFLKQQSPRIILVGNRHIPEHIRTVLFGPDCMFVQTPESNSYDEIDRIEQDCKRALKKAQEQGEYVVVVTSMGCAGRVLQKRLWYTHENLFLFDFGSLMDALCGWNTRAWIELSKFDKDSFIESLTNHIHMVYTAALIDTDYKARMREYERSLQRLLSYGQIPYIIESHIKRGTTFFDRYGVPVIYTRTNNVALRNKGVNEVRSMRAAFDQLPFADTDMVIKLTGRYYLESDSFLRLVKEHSDIEAFVKLDECGQVFTGCFAMSFGHFKQVFALLDLQKMERDMINLEREIASYISAYIPPDKIMYVSHLDLTAAIFGTGQRQILNL